MNGLMRLRVEADRPEREDEAARDEVAGDAGDHDQRGEGQDQHVRPSTDAGAQPSPRSCGVAGVRDRAGDR